MNSFNFKQAAVPLILVVILGVVGAVFFLPKSSDKETNKEQPSASQTKDTVEPGDVVEKTVPKGTPPTDQEIKYFDQDGDNALDSNETTYLDYYRNNPEIYKEFKETWKAEHK